MDHEIMPVRHWLVPIVILARGPVPDRPTRSGSSRSWVPVSACPARAEADVDARQPISSVETAVSRALRGGEQR
jgi:hypothetical protein